MYASNDDFCSLPFCDNFFLFSDSFVIFHWKKALFFSQGIVDCLKIS